LRESVREALAGQMEYTYFPVSLDRCAANIHYHDLVEGSFAIDDISVSARYLNHPHARVPPAGRWSNSRLCLRS
jgi:hypothetical protein